MKEINQVSQNPLSLESEFPKTFVRFLEEKKLTIAGAESCTGGLIAKILTDISGSSEVFHGSLVCYSNEVKEKVLNVPPHILREKGAVSFETAVLMRQGLKKYFGSDLLFSVTGIAGPNGGSKEKPVGTVFFSIQTPSFSSAFHFVFDGNREQIRNQASLTVLKLFWLILNKQPINRLPNLKEIQKNEG